jgi:hypothetical protein
VSEDTNGKNGTNDRIEGTPDYEQVAPQEGVIQFDAGPGKQKDNSLLYAAGDVIVWLAAMNTAGPSTGFEDITTLTGYYCAGWVDTSGYIFKLDETTKDVTGAGSLTPIRTILTGGTKSVQQTFLEGQNPYARALYDDVPIFPVTSSPLKPVGSTAPFIASYIIPDPPADNRYAMIWDSVDGDKAMRLYAPNCKVTARGNDQVQQADIESFDITVTMYPGNVAGSVFVAQRFIQYATNMAGYFT